ncbi:hypothetical protein WJX73_000428 [Symbiochloris irregularis]|uniref:Phosphoglycerate mutase n=1 Tax=Symbiochloris irregularis TaxID=706552 RepID=A0AAW1PAF1_9CHLO
MDSQRIFLARHGERADLAEAGWSSSPEGRLDPYDPPLTARGFQQAHELGLRLQEENITQIYSSPFIRTLQTAHQVAEVLDLSVLIEQGLCEGMLSRLFPAGPPCFKTAKQLASKLPRARAPAQPVTSVPAFPETYSTARRRCNATAQALARKHPNENILLVAHGLSVEYLALSLVHQKRKGSLDIPYCCLTECIRDGPDQDSWQFGVLMQQDFLTQKEPLEEAQRQRRMWGLDDSTA